MNVCANNCQRSWRLEICWSLVSTKITRIKNPSCNASLIDYRGDFLIFKERSSAETKNLYFSMPQSTQHTKHIFPIIVTTEYSQLQSVGKSNSVPFPYLMITWPCPFWSTSLILKCQCWWIISCQVQTVLIDLWCELKAPSPKSLQSAYTYLY